MAQQTRQEEPKQPDVQGGGEPAEEPKAESFFDLPEDLAVTPEQLNVMNSVGKQWQANITKRIQSLSDENKSLKSENEELRRENVLNQEAARAWDMVMQNPQFAAFYESVQRGEDFTPAKPAVQPQNQGGFNYDDFEGGAALRSFKDEVKSEVLEGVASLLEKRFAPIEQVMGQTKMQADMAALDSYAKQVGGPDPNDERIQRQMSFYRQRYKDLPLNEIYDLVRVKMGKLEPAGNSGQDIQAGEGGKTPVTIPPRGTAVNVNPLEGKSPLDVAQDLHKSKEGKRGIRARDRLKEVLGEFVEKTGVSATLDDLSR